MRWRHHGARARPIGRARSARRKWRDRGAQRVPQDDETHATDRLPRRTPRHPSPPEDSLESPQCAG
eukprot:621486-Pyramimonas_sp.AAC.1